MSQKITKSNNKSQKQDYKISIYPLEDMYNELVEEAKQAKVKLSHYVIHLLIDRHKFTSAINSDYIHGSSD